MGAYSAALRMIQLNRWRCLLVLIAALTCRVQAFEPEPIGVTETLPAVYPDHWVMIHDASFFHMFEGEIIVTDPLGETLGDQYKGMMTASFIAAYQRSRSRNEHYVIETFYSRGGRGGERTDVVTIYSTDRLEIVDEIEIPAKRISGMPKTLMTGLVGGEKFLAVYNFTPAQSVSIVDLEKRAFVGEVATGGCGFVIPNGQRSFTSICSNGSFLTTHLSAQGKATGTSVTESLFNAEEDPVFEIAGVTGGVAYLPTFAGRFLPLNVSDTKVTAGQMWWMTAPEERNWRPGGLKPLTVDASGIAYVLMNPEGGEGTHKDGGAEVWAYDLAAGQRTGRIELASWGLTVATSGTGDDRLLYVTNTDMALDIYTLSNGNYLKTLNIGAQTPFLLHGAQ